MLQRFFKEILFKNSSGIIIASIIFVLTKKQRMSKKIIYVGALWLMAMLSAGTSFSQNYNVTDAKGFKQGKWQKKGEKGNIVYEGNFMDNRPVGEFKYYYEEGMLESVVNYLDNANTKAVMYHKTGKKLAEGSYKNKKKDGLWKYYNKDGSLLSEEYYAMGVAKGVWKKYFENGKLYEECVYVNGNKQGVLKQYFENGKTKALVSFDKGMMTGEATFYFLNGNILQRGFYKNDVKDGVWISMKENGDKVSEIEYNNGKVIREVYYDKTREQEVKEEPKPIKSSIK